MSAKLEKIESSEAYLEIEVDADTLEAGLDQAFKKVSKQVAIPGFRKGRVPRQLLEAHYGPEVLFEDALEIIVPSAYEDAIKELAIDAIGQPEFDIQEIESGKPLKFTAKVAVKPEVKLGELEGLDIQIPRFEVSEEDVNNKMEEMRARYAQVVEKADEPAELGDTLTIDFEGFVNDVAFEGGKGEDYNLELGSATFIPGFEEQLVGVKTGESKDVNVAFPEEYHAEDLAGQDALFKVTVKKIETKELRELNDEFAQEVSEFENIAELREDLKKNLEQMHEMRKQSMTKDEAVNKAVELCEIEVPNAAIEVQFQNMLQQLEQRMSMQGLNLEQYFQFTGSNMDDFRKEIWPEAEKNSRVNFMLEKIVEEKGIEVSDEELEKEIEDIASRMGLEADKAKENLASVMDNIVANIKMDKAVQYLVDKAVITESDESQEDSAE